MSPKRILLLHKKSAYTVYFLEKTSSLYKKDQYFPASEIRGFKASHEEHYRTLQIVEESLRSLSLSYQKICRGRKIDFDRFDFLLTVGGDGTFLEGARGIKQQMILGVNSDRKSSVGRFCLVDRHSIKKAIDLILQDKYRVRSLPRIQAEIKFKEEIRTIPVLNDILISHQNPAAMSRYYLKVKQRREEQRSSGVWISTGAGSSGAIHSAGGEIFDQESDQVQYKPRELYSFKNAKYLLQGRILKLKDPIEVTSLMRNGVIFLDGAHLKFPFNFGNIVKLTHSDYPVKMIEPKL